MHVFLEAYQPPYDWDMVRSFLGARRIPGVECLTEDGYGRSFRMDGVSGFVGLRHVPDADAFEVSTAADGPLPAGFRARVRTLLDLDMDQAAIGAVLCADPLTAALWQRFPGTRLPGCWDPFEFSVRAVLGQQISVKAATTLAGRIADRYGPAFTGPHPVDATRPTHFFPTAAELVGQGFEGIGLTRTRTATLMHLVDAVASGRVRLSRADGFDAFVTAFTALPGIGPWTAHYVGMRGLSYPDAFPESDLGILKALAGEGPRPRPAEVRARAEAWRPWRAYAAILLWRALA